MEIKLIFNNPNSLNNHWSKSRSGVFLSAKGREFRNHVIDVVTKAGFKDLKLTGRLRYYAIYHAPDKRVRDIDNFCTKAVFDSLTHAGLYVDDTQIDYVEYKRGEISKNNAYIEITITNYIEPTKITINHQEIYNKLLNKYK